MSRWLGWVALPALLLGCDAPAVAPPEPLAAGPSSAAASASARPRSSRPRPGARPGVKKPATQPSLTRLSLEAGGRWRAEGKTAGKPLAVVLSTKQRPLSPRAPAAHGAVARLVAPHLAAPTSLAAIPLAELTRAAADDRTRRALADSARVLADGTVLAALIELPEPPLKTVDLADLAEGRRAWSWESKLSTKQDPPADQVQLLASYQTLLALDYLVDNLSRQQVALDEAGGRLVAIEGNDVFSGIGKGGAVGDAFGRLSGHLVYSKSLKERLSKLDKAGLELALRESPDRSLLVTPKQLDEIMARKGTLERLLEARIRQRGRERALALP
jgi:hypothetical protein